MPYYNCPETIGRAVDAILNQTFTDWILSIIVDGCPAPNIPRDPRIRVFQTEENRGCYYASALNLAACETEWFTVHDSDDWTHPDRYESLLDLSDGFDAVMDGVVRHRITGEQKKYPSSHTGLFRTEKLRYCGAHPDFRCSWDTSLNKLFRHAFRVREAAFHKYHAFKRPGSLTMGKEYGAKSAYRQAAHAERARLMAKCYASPISRWPRILSPKPDTQKALERDLNRYRGQFA